MTVNELTVNKTNDYLNNNTHGFNAYSYYNDKGLLEFQLDDSVLPEVSVVFTRKPQNIPGYDSLQVSDTKYGTGKNERSLNLSTERGLNLVTPEFDVISGGTLLAKDLVNLPKTIKAIRQFRNLEKGFTGVPHNRVKGDVSKFMDTEFGKGNYSGTIWTTDNPEYAMMFGENFGGKTFDVYFPKKLNLLDTPKPSNSEFFSWRDLPFRGKNGVITLDKNAYRTLALGVFNDPLSSINHNMYGIDSPNKLYKIGLQKNKFDFRPALTTDNVVRYSRMLNKDGTRFHRILDGGIENRGLQGGILSTNKYRGYFYDSPINEVVLNPGVEKYVFPYNTSKSTVLQSFGAYNYSPYDLIKYIPQTIMTGVRLL